MIDRINKIESEERSKKRLTYFNNSKAGRSLKKKIKANIWSAWWRAFILFDLQRREN